MQILENFKAGNLPTVETSVTLTEKTFALIFQYAIMTTVAIILTINIFKVIGKLINKQ